MNTNILKVTLLCMGALVNSHPTPESVEIPYQFKNMELHSLLFKDGVFPYFGSEHFNTQIQVSLAAWKPGNRIAKGTYYLYLFSKDYYHKNLKLKLGEIEYNDNEHKDWVRITTLNWVNIPIDFLDRFSLMLKSVDTDINDRKSFSNSSAQNWTYNIFFKTKDASLEGIRENENDLENPTIEFCSRDITILGPNRTLGAQCIFDPQTRKSMHQCLNWRRVDLVGIKCRDIMNIEDMENSMDGFCAKDLWLIDCKCLNRRYYKEYQERKLIEKIPDYCWYHPCKQNSYLTKRKGERVQCIYEHCENIHVYGTRYILSCKRTESGLPEYPSVPMDNPDY